MKHRLAYMCVCFIALGTGAACGEKSSVVRDGKKDAASKVYAANSPSAAVQSFYRLMNARRFREAFALTVYRPAIEGLSEAEYEELRPDFEETALATPREPQINGEQISGDTATVFLTTEKEATNSSANANQPKTQVVPVTLKLDAEGKWIIGDEREAEAVRADSKSYFFKRRIETHHAEAQAMLNRIALAEVAYSAQNGGRAATLRALIEADLVPQDAASPETTGYNYRVTLKDDGKVFQANAEPARYGRSGVLSFVMDEKGMRSRDAGGKPLTGEAERE
ncbi:MAG: hypothetical protein MSG64_07740 [Pyrinomonadaceae bacterium MAG19_C2-C3]|nr:hypothetical protein [Pyrinomonadaceae bacterium MAG19_C2-C3]